MGWENYMSNLGLIIPIDIEAVNKARSRFDIIPLKPVNR